MTKRSKPKLTAPPSGSVYLLEVLCERDNDVVGDGRNLLQVHIHLDQIDERLCALYAPLTPQKNVKILDALWCILDTSETDFYILFL